MVAAACRHRQGTVLAQPAAVRSWLTLAKWLCKIQKIWKCIYLCVKRKIYTTTWLYNSDVVCNHRAYLHRHTIYFKHVVCRCLGLLGTGALEHMTRRNSLLLYGSIWEVLSLFSQFNFLTGGRRCGNHAPTPSAASAWFCPHELTPTPRERRRLLLQSC